MKKTFRIIGLALVAVIVTLCFAACGSDDPADPESHDKDLVGTWVAEYQSDDYYEKTTLQFKSNGAFRIDAVYEDDEETEKGWAKGEWETDNGFIYVTITSASDDMEIDDFITLPYTIRGKKLYIDDMEFVRK